MSLRKRISERICEQIVDVPARQTLEELQERILEHMNDQIVDVPMPKTVDQPGDQVCQDPTDSIHRQSCRHACGVAATGPSDLDSVESRLGRSSAKLWTCL